MVWLTLPRHIENKPWMSRKDNKAVKTIIQRHILLWKTTEGNTRLRVKVMVRVRFLFELAPIDPWCNRLQTSCGQKKYQEAMSYEQLLSQKIKMKVFPISQTLNHNISHQPNFLARPIKSNHWVKLLGYLKTWNLGVISG